MKTSMPPPDPNPLAAVSSPDHNEERLATLKQLLPDLFTNEGRLNLDELKKVVDPAFVTETARYDFRWYGKTHSKREAFTPSRAALVYDKDRSVNPDKAGGNMIIEGENLEVLKLLNSAYRERIKCIYIDPPYNTGKDFVYSDRFAEGQKPYWEQTGVTEDGVKVDTNTDSDGRFHSNWLSMMHSRLLVARYLLRPDGLIFVSIDDRELQNLLRLMDEVFGEENLRGCVARSTGTPTGAGNDILLNEIDYVVIYSRTDEGSFEGLDLSEEDERIYDKQDTQGRYLTRPLRKTGGEDRQEDRPTMCFEIVGPDGKKVVPIGPGGYRSRWRCGPARYEQLVNEGLIEWKETVENEKKKWTPYRKFYLEGRKKQPSNLWTDIEGNKKASIDVKNLFGAKVFDFPKPSELIQRCLAIAGGNDGIILDFFGGSGTTAQAVIELNRTDGGDRRFILIQLPEITGTDSPAYQSGFKKISDITIERAKRVIARIQYETEELLSNDPQRQFADGLGFKVFKLGKSHFPRVEFTPDPDKTEEENIELLKQYIREKEGTFHIQWEREAVLDEVLLKNGFMLDYTLIPHPEFKKNDVFLAKDAHKESLICLDASISPETVDHFKKHNEHFFICLELAIDTTKKWNLKHHLGDKLKAI